MSETGISEQRRRELEQEIGAILDTKVADGNAGKNQQHIRVKILYPDPIVFTLRRRITW